MSFVTYQSEKSTGSNAHSVSSANYVVPEPLDPDPQDPIGTAPVAVIINDAKTKIEVMDALKAIMRRLHRDGLKSNLPSQFQRPLTTTE